MPEPVPKRPHGTFRDLAAAITALGPPRRRRQGAFKVCVLGISAGFVALAVAARTVAYLPIDLAVTHAVQSCRGAVLTQLMVGLSWLGFVPQVGVLGCLAISLLFLAGLRWEGVVALFAAGATAAGTLVKLLVHRPRPSASLVHVFRELHSSGFPSGHVLEFTGFCGYLAFLVYALLRPSWVRTWLLVALAIFLVLMGVSRIYLGQHWISDVMGAYMLGGLWLALTVQIYRWGRPRFFRHDRRALSRG